MVLLGTVAMKVLLSSLLGSQDDVRVVYSFRFRVNCTISQSSLAPTHFNVTLDTVFGAISVEAHIIQSISKYGHISTTISKYGHISLQAQSISKYGHISLQAQSISKYGHISLQAQSISKYGCISLQAHIGAILLSKFTSYRNFHTQLYTCAAEFDFLAPSYVLQLSLTLLLPVACVVGVMVGGTVIERVRGEGTVMERGEEGSPKSAG